MEKLLCSLPSQPSLERYAPIEHSESPRSLSLSAVEAEVSVLKRRVERLEGSRYPLQAQEAAREHLALIRRFSHLR